MRLGRVRNSGEIKKRIKRIMDMMQTAYRSAKRGSTVRKFRTDYKRLRTLYRKGVHRRIWNEAADNPGGLIDLTLDYGYDRARQITLEREKRRRGRLRRVR